MTPGRRARRTSCEHVRATADPAGRRAGRASRSSRPSCSQLLPGDPVTTIAPFATPAQRASIRDSSDSTSRSRAVRQLARRLRPGDSANYYRDRRCADPVSTDVGTRSPRVAAADALRADPHAADRDPARACSPPTEPARASTRSSNTGAFAFISHPELRARARARRTVLGVQLGWLPDERLRAVRRRIPSSTSSTWCCPSISLAVGQIAVYMRLLRSDMIATLQEDFILDGEGQGHHRPAASSGATRCGRRASRCSRSPASTSARSSAARSSSRSSSASRAWATRSVDAIAAGSTSRSRASSRSSRSSTCS